MMNKTKIISFVTAAVVFISLAFSMSASAAFTDLQNFGSALVWARIVQERLYDNPEEVGRWYLVDDTLTCYNGVAKYTFADDGSDGGGEEEEGGGGGGGGGESGNVSQCTQYTAGNWGVCTGFDSETGEGGTQTREVIGSTGGCPGNKAPATSQTCNIPFDFSLAKPAKAGVGGNGQSLVIGSTHEIEVVFVGDSQSEISSETIIAVSPTFSKHPNMSDIIFSVSETKPALPSGVQYIFTPFVLEPGEYSSGVSFSVEVPRLDSGEYMLKINVEGGGVVRVADIKLKVRSVDPEFKEI